MASDGAAPAFPPVPLGRGLLHARLALAAVLAAGGWGVSATVVPPVAPYRFGEGIGRFAAVVVLVVFAPGPGDLDWILDGLRAE